MIDNILFFGFGAVLIFSAIGTVFLKEVIKSALCLVIALFSAAILWLILEAEFLGLALVVVYIGAIITLFLFVIMTLSPESISVSGLWKRYSLSIILAAIWLSLMLYSGYQQFEQLNIISPSKAKLQVLSQSLSNTQLLGKQLYTQHTYPLEITGVLLLIAVIASISLTNIKQRNKSPKIMDKNLQINIKRKDRIRLVKGH